MTRQKPDWLMPQEPFLSSDDLFPWRKTDKGWELATDDDLEIPPIAAIRGPWAPGHLKLEELDRQVAPPVRPVGFPLLICIGALIAMSAFAMLAQLAAVMGWI